MTQKKVPNHDHLDPKTKYLFEVTGHYGPWTSKEYDKAFPPVPVERPPAPKPPKEVVDTERAADDARLAFEAAHRAWGDAAVAHREAEARVGSG